MSRQKSKAPSPIRPKQPTPEDLRDTLLNFIQRHFYPQHPIPFAKDRPRLLQWVILRLARYLDERAVTLPAIRYQEIMQSILLDALRLGDTSNITYLPAWLGKVVESHLAHHGEEYYDEGKSIRAQVDAAISITGRPTIAPDPVRELAHASRLLSTRRRKTQRKVIAHQPDLFQ